MNTVSDRAVKPAGQRNFTGVRKESRLGKLFTRFESRTDLPVLYLSGPMTGQEDFNFPYFNEVARKLRVFGFPVLNPADFGADPARTHEECLARDVECLRHGDILVLLPNWEKSKGACIEYDAADGLRKPIVLLSDFLDLVALHFFDEPFLGALVRLDAARADLLAVFNDQGEVAITPMSTFRGALLEDVVADFMAVMDDVVVLDRD